MKKILLSLTLLAVFTLSACSTDGEGPELDYEDFAANFATSAEQIDNTEYDANFVYFYDDSVTAEEMKAVILNFFDNNEAVPFYLVDLNEVSYSTIYGEITEPTMLVVGDGVIKEYFSGVELLEFFLLRYGTVDMTDYKHFINSTTYTYAQLETMNDDQYVAYYYSDNCGHCQSIKADVLTFFNTYEGLPFYFLDIQDAPDQTRTSEFYGTPSLFIFTNGVVTETYIGPEQVLEFIEDNS